MRKPTEIERLYLDFDGFFASVMQQVHPALRGKPVGVTPFEATEHTCVIACSREAKAFGVKNVMPLEEAKELCPQLILVPQNPDLYRRAHNTLISEIEAVVPVEAVKSIDEMTCRVDPSDRAQPLELGRLIKERIAKYVGPWITCSIGFAANRQLAKMACKAGKRQGVGGYGNGNLAWHPADMPAPLFDLKLSDVPGIGARMEQRLVRSGITSMETLLSTQPKQMRQIWGNVTGERLWYALHGYEIQSQPQSRGMYGHGRVLPPTHRSLDDAHDASRLLLIKAARRMRRDGFNAGRVLLWLQMREKAWSRVGWLPIVHDDQAILTALEVLWTVARRQLPSRTRAIQIGVTLMDLTLAKERQLDLLLNDDPLRKRWEDVTTAIDRINGKHGRTLVNIGPWTPPPGGYAGGKISYTRIPRAEDFW